MRWIARAIVGVGCLSTATYLLAYHADSGLIGMKVIGMTSGFLSAWNLLHVTFGTDE